MSSQPPDGAVANKACRGAGKISDGDTGPRMCVEPGSFGPPAGCFPSDSAVDEGKAMPRLGLVVLQRGASTATTTSRPCGASSRASDPASEPLSPKGCAVSLLWLLAWPSGGFSGEGSSFAFLHKARFSGAAPVARCSSAAWRRAWRRSLARSNSGKPSRESTGSLAEAPAEGSPPAFDPDSADSCVPGPAS